MSSHEGPCVLHAARNGQLSHLVLHRVGAFSLLSPNSVNFWNLGHKVPFFSLLEFLVVALAARQGSYLTFLLFVMPETVLHRTPVAGAGNIS